MATTVLVVPDLQTPFHHKDAFAFLRRVKKIYRPNEVVNIGDEVDFHALSNYEHDPDGYSPGKELIKARAALKELYKIFPRSKVCISNHTSRPYRRAHKFGIPRAFLRDYKEFLEAPNGWEWRDYWIIDGVRYEHGDALGGGLGKTAATRAALVNQRSTVFGHFHSYAGIHYTASPEDLIFGFNVGCLIDFKSYAFKYAKSHKARPVLGCGIVEDRIPTFIPMVLNGRGRWNGKL
jgi:hypothetical protein